MATNLKTGRASTVANVISFCFARNLNVNDLFSITPDENGYSIFYNGDRADVTAPTITCSDIANDQPSGKAVAVYASVTPWCEALSLRLFYRIPAGAWVEVTMKNIAPGVYKEYIQGDAVTVAGVEWYLVAEDAHGNTGEFGTAGVPKTFTVV